MSTYSIPKRVKIRLQRSLARRRLFAEVAKIHAYLEGVHQDSGPVLIFNASTRIDNLSLNAAYALIASWSLQSAGVEVWHMVCHEGLQQCVLGTRVDDPTQNPPCDQCLSFSRSIFQSDKTIPLRFDRNVIEEFGSELGRLNFDQLSSWVHDDLPFGELCLPGLRWALRRHHLPDDDLTRDLMRKYLLSAISLARSVSETLDRLKPHALIVFNGIMYPEAVARGVAAKKGVDVITHEVGLRPYSAFFSHKHATFREVQIQRDRALGRVEDEKLDRYLEDRASGQFSMAGIEFWPEMQSLPAGIKDLLDDYPQVVPIFTNVIFDTSQVHANTLFSDMMQWLDGLAVVMAEYPQTLFIIRAHPDEDREGKASRESVAQWVAATGVDDLENVEFIPPSQYVSSYDLIRLAKFVLVYNSSIGLEASIMGAPVLCAGRARYTQVPTVYYPGSKQEYYTTLREMLVERELVVPEMYRFNARLFLYHELFKASIDLSMFLDPYPHMPGFVTLKRLATPTVFTDPTGEMEILRDGVLRGMSFEYRN